MTLYGTRTCGYCRQARTFFGANSVPFSDVSTESSAGVEAGFAHVARCGQPGRLSTPTVIIEKLGKVSGPVGGYRNDRLWWSDDLKMPVRWVISTKLDGFGSLRTDADLRLAQLEPTG